MRVRLPLPQDRTPVDRGPLKPMFSVSVECELTQKEHLVTELHEMGTTGILEEDLPGGRCRLAAFFDDEGRAALAARRLGAYGAIVREEDDRDWVRVSQALWQPLLVGERFFLVPPWRGDPTPAGRIRLEMPVGQASGTGLHPATQLAIETMERVLRTGDRVLDLGTGSGILAAAASLLGAGEVAGCDIDAEAVAAAREYLSAAAPNTSLFAGSVRSVRNGCADLLVANINAVTIVNLAREIARVLKPQGKAVLTGFPRVEAVQIGETFAELGLPPRERLESGDWACLVAGPRG